MAFVKGSEKNFDTLDHVGVAIKEVGKNQNHIGVVYRPNSNEVRFCHLAWHHDFRDGAAKPEYLWDQCKFLDNFNGQLLAARILDVARKSPKIPYSIDCMGVPFDEKGNFIPFSGEGMGLTCATFIIALFTSAGFPIVKAETWRRRPDDEAWQGHIIQALSGHPDVSEEHIEAARNMTGAVRFRPEEVAVSAASANAPLAYSEAIELAADLQNIISSASSSS